jgi:hypothetical protein
MKKISLLFAFVALFASASFADTNEERPIKTTLEKEKPEMLKIHSCKVTVTTGGYNATITYTCQTDCTPKEACDKAYAAASALLTLVN